MGGVQRAGQGEIAEAIEQLRAQLCAAQDAGEDSRLQFQITEVEMEFQVEVRSEAGASGGIRLGVAKLGADGRTSQGSSHRLRLTLDVQDTRTGRKATVSDKR
ncbi:trypco2 family protein [Streptomyces sp. NPDC056910]|uniref:trypco2 family protein n=1 Tax=Streptomyces sp. NPDC056910 TaxID=3345964 RepID=UPI003673CFDF